MHKTQIQLPDALYDKARRFADAQEMSLAEVTRRSLEQFLDRYPGADEPPKKWSVPLVDAGGPVKVSAKKLKQILDQESVRGISG